MAPPSEQEVEVRYEEASIFRKFFNLPLSFSLTEEIKKATFTMQNIDKSRISKWDSAFTKRMIRDADALCFLTTFRASAVVSGHFGTGLIIARLPDGSWSAPCAIATIGTGIGPQLGVDISDMVLVMRTKEAVHTFTGNNQLAVGASMGVAIGPFGRHALGELCLGDTRRLAVSWAYAASKGWFAGGSVEGTYLRISRGANKTFYGQTTESEDILTGKVPRPKAAQPLYDALEEVLRLPPTVTSPTSSPTAVMKETMQQVSGEQQQQEGDTSGGGLMSETMTS